MTMDCRALRDRLLAGAAEDKERPAAAGHPAVSGQPGTTITMTGKPAAPVRPEDPKPSEVAAHLAACPGCTGFARRLALARGALREGGCEVLPDGGFAARLAARLPRRHPGGELLGWAALRALPAALLLALVLAGLAAAEISPPDSLLVDDPSTSQLLAWSAQAQGGTR
jgi:hypothetical protein